ncbi:MAG TPA: response regulator, partial [Candidatus Xenobia bacterium]
SPMARVLIVEDSPTQADYIQSILEEHGFQVSSALSGRAALELLRDAGFDLVISDILMPEMSGFELCRAIKQHSRTPVMLVTSLSDPMDMVAALECGADNFISKPYDPEYLVRRAQSLVHSQQPEVQSSAQTLVEITFQGRRFAINCDRQQIVSMLVSSFEDVVSKNHELLRAQADLEAVNRLMDSDLRDTRTHLEALFRAIPDALMMEDLGRRIVTCNPAGCRLFGYREAELAGQDVSTLLGERLGSGPEATYRKRDGTTFIGESIVREVPDRRGKVIGYVHIIRDVTARRQLEEEFRQAQKMEAVGRLAGGVAHDFNNMLTVILGSADLIRRELQGRPGEWLDDLKTIEEATQGAARLCRQLLTLSRRQATQEERYDLDAVVQATSKMLPPLLGENVVLRLTSCPDAWVVGDKNQMQQVLLNLVVNAKEAMPKGGLLAISTQVHRVRHGDSHFDLDEGVYCVLSVSDNGSGMEATVRDRIFDPFYTTKASGTGLGLSTVYGIVHRAQGRIWVYSELGSGTTFKIYLPYRPESPAPLSERPAVDPEEAKRAVHDATVLVVEDDERVRRVAFRALERDGYRVLSAASGDQAVQCCAAFDGVVNLLLTDMVMPRMSGVELSRRLQGLYPALKVVFTSGYSEEVMRAGDLADQQAWFLEKPFSLEDLRRKVQEVLSATAP